MKNVFHSGDRIQVSEIPEYWTNCKGETGIVLSWVNGDCYYVQLDSGRVVALMAWEMVKEAVS